MRKLNTNEWVAVSVSIVVIGAFIYFFSFMPVSQQSQPTDNNAAAASVTPINTDQVAQKGSVVTVNYTGMFQNGKVFDTSAGRGPITFTLGQGQVIAGWDEGLMGMKAGDKKHLVIPPEKAYGVQGYPPAIPPNSTLIFDVEMVNVQNQ